MAIKYGKVIGIVVGIAMVGITVYAIKKYYDEKKQDEQSIGLDEAKEIVEEGRETLNIDQISDDDKDYIDAHTHHKVRGMGLTDDIDMEDVKFGARDLAHYDPGSVRKNNNRKKKIKDEVLDYGSKDKPVLDNDEMERLVDDARDTAHWNASFTNGPIGIKPDDLAATLEDVEEETEEWFEGPDPQEVQDSKQYFEEDKDVIDDLRYTPDSVEAREQFINMELANLGRDNDTRDVVAMLYDHPFNPIGDEDNNLKIRLMDHRIRFFGERSKWINEVTYGDVVMYYGKAAEFNCGETVMHWVDYFITCADINHITLTSDDINETLNSLNKHNFFNQELQSYGLFGLNSFQMTEAIKVAKTHVDERVTYDIEFHKFIESVIQ